MTEKRISLDKLLSTDAAWKIIETAKNEEIKKLKVQQRDQATGSMSCGGSLTFVGLVVVVNETTTTPTRSRPRDQEIKYFCYPPGLPPTKMVRLVGMLSRCPAALRQEVLYELAARHAKRQIRSSLAAYLNSLILRAQRGEFVLAAGEVLKDSVERDQTFWLSRKGALKSAPVVYVDQYGVAKLRKRTKSQERSEQETLSRANE